MDKITRILLLYSKLKNGEPVNKLTFCMETDTTSRSFDRDIEDIRLYLADMFQTDELLYDRKSNNYYLSGIRRQELELAEYKFIEKMLVKSKVLRRDELLGMLIKLSSNTKNAQSIIKKVSVEFEEYDNRQTAPLLKIHSDLCNVLENEYRIRIEYISLKGDEVSRERIIPFDIEYGINMAYLVAFNEEDKNKAPVYYSLDRIYSFSITGKMNEQDSSLVSEYRLMEKGKHQEEEEIDVVISCDKQCRREMQTRFRTDVIEVSADGWTTFAVKCKEQKIIDWILKQPPGMCKIRRPDSLIIKINNIIDEFKSFYGNGG